VEVIDDQERAIVMPGELRQNSVGDRRLVEVGRRCRLGALAGGAGSLLDGVEYGEPELLRVLLVAPYLDDCQPVRLAWAICPRPQ
jgi:hypothetical protein